MSKYRCKYEYSLRFGSPNHIWSVVGSKGGLHLSIIDHGEEFRLKHGHRYSGGIERHSRVPTDDTAPDHDDCWLLHAPCWHDGSSLQASEIWIPRWEADPHDHDGMFRSLEVEADGIFDSAPPP